MTDRTIINPPALKFGINEVVYLRESALLGYLEPLKISRGWYDPKSSRNVYSFIFKKSRPNVQISGDAIDLLSSKSIKLFEQDLVTFKEALSLKYNSLNRELTKTNQQLSEFGSPSIDVSTEDGLDFGDVSAAEPSAGAGSHIDRTFKVINNGDIDLMLSGSPKVEVLGDQDDFTVINQPSSQIDPSDSSSFILRFAPIELGRRVGIILITSNDPNYPNFTFSVEGVGI